MTYWIKQRPERSTAVNQFIRLLDEVRKEDVRRDPTRRWRERLRKVPENQQETKMDALPLGMPIDYFDPDYFNGLQPRLRYRITNSQVALPPDIKKIFKSRSKLNDQDITETYGSAILAKYEVVNEEDLQAYDSDDEDDSDGQDDLSNLDDDHNEDFNMNEGAGLNNGGSSSEQGETSASGRKRRRL